jgi:hypothetical protein
MIPALASLGRNDGEDLFNGLARGKLRVLGSRPVSPGSGGLPESPGTINPPRTLPPRRKQERKVMPVPDHRAPDPGRRPASSGAIFFALACAAFLLGGIAYVAVFGVPGGPGGTSDLQQQTSHPPATPAPNADATLGNAGTRETQGYTAPETPRQQ